MILVVEESSGRVFTPDVLKFGMAVTDLGDGVIQVGACNDCNECDPPIPDTLYVTWAGLRGDFAHFNGTHPLTWETGCTWNAEIGTGEALLAWTGSQWLINLVERYDCDKQWRSPASPNSDSCDPRDTYSEHVCSDIYCTDHDTCEKSAGATAVISYTP